MGATNSTEKTEADYIFDKTMRCDACNKDFKTKQVRTGKARFLGTDDILRPMYEGVDTCKYDIILCPHCGYAAPLHNYGHLTSKQRQAVKENISSRFTARENDPGAYSYDRAIKRCKMAMLSAMVVGAKISESAYLCLKLAWLYRGEIEEARRNGIPAGFTQMFERYENEYLEDAYKGFIQAIATEYPPIAGMDEVTINFLMTSIAVKLGKYDEARHYGAVVLSSKAASAKIKDKTRDVLEAAKKFSTKGAN